VILLKVIKPFIAQGDQTVVWAVRKGKEVADLIDSELIGGTK
jgi:dihydropyrimidine dehydrogenase (NAD+) subunit PreT